MRPLSSDFEDAGVIDALLNIFKDMSKEYKTPDLPEWVLKVRIVDVVGSEIEIGHAGPDHVVKSAAALVVALAELEQRLLEYVGSSHCIGNATTDARRKDVADEDSEQGRIHVIALARLLVGACCEAYATIKCNRLSSKGFRPVSEKVCQKMARIYKDACLAATWTSAHAMFLHDVQRDAVVVSNPCIHSVPCESAEPELSNLYMRRFSARQCESKSATAMLTLLTRCTNAGARGWDGLLPKTFNGVSGTKRVCADALCVSLTGMNSCIHPSSRMHWKDRLALVLFLSNENMFVQVTGLSENATYFKECIRRMLSNTCSAAYATNTALARLQHPTALLMSCPQKLPIVGLEFSATAFANAGKMLVSSRGTQEIASCIDIAFTSQPTNRAEQSDWGGCEMIRWNPAYLGRSLIKCTCRIACNLLLLLPASRFLGARRKHARS